MKNSFLVLVAIALLYSKQVHAQKNLEAIAGTVATLGVIAGAILSAEDMEERAELKATEWILANHPEFSAFNLKTLDFNGKKAKDISSTSVISFKFQEFTPRMEPTLDGKKYILFCFTSYGWVSDQGMDFSRVSWFLVDDTEWMKMMIKYTKVSSEEKDEFKLKEILQAGVVDDKGIKIKNKMVLPFYKLSGDAYLVSDYSPEMKFIYNEKSLCIFLKKTSNLIQMRKKTIIETHNFLFQ
jgi:hypothetical protein